VNIGFRGRRKNDLIWNNKCGVVTIETIYVCSPTVVGGTVSGWRRGARTVPSVNTVNYDNIRTAAFFKTIYRRTLTIFSSGLRGGASRSWCWLRRADDYFTGREVRRGQKQTS